MPSKTVNQGRATKQERGDELYPTPEALTIAFLKSGEQLPKLIWEPACGLGHMVKPLVAAGHEVIATDVIKYGWAGQMVQKDFLDFDQAPRFTHGAKQATCIVTNPPFSLSADFVRHGLKLCDKVCVLNRLAFLEGKGRSDIIDRHLVRVYPLIERPPMMHRWKLINGAWTEWEGKRAPSAMPVAWFVFERNGRGAAIETRRISWRRAMKP